jgi:hypothetical protein
MSPEQPDTEDEQEFYLRTIRDIVQAFKLFQGSKSALIKARKAPLDINPEGHIEGYYGKGEKVLLLLMDQYSEFIGEEAAYSQVRGILGDDLSEDELELLPEQFHPQKEQQEGLLDIVLQKLSLK